MLFLSTSSVLYGVVDVIAAAVVVIITIIISNT